MRLRPVLAMVRKDLLIFFGDRRSVIVAFVVPIAIASFFGAIFGGGSGNSEPAKIDVSIIDQDNSAISKGIVSGARRDKNLRVLVATEQTARDAVKRGKTSVVVIIPAAFGDAAGRAFLGLAPQPALRVLYDPSHRTELAMVSGILTQYVMQAVSREMFGGQSGRRLVNQSLPQVDSMSMDPVQRSALRQMLQSVQSYYDRDSARGSSGGGGLAMPYTVTEEAVTSGANVNYNGYAHSFGGMGVQFLLFAMANLGIEMLLERQRGLWKRLRSAPVSRFMLLGGKVLSGALISLLTLWVSFAFAMIVFRVRIQGSIPGFIGVSVACALMAATFGLLVAALGKTPATARGVTTLAVLMMVMLGGAWVPAFIFPAWLQQATKVVPVRWAIDGLDAMTWRGLGFDGAVVPILVLLAFAAVFAAVAAARFQWEEA